ncbi:MAG: transmembrane anchor protein [Granulosicoccus sp.]
MPSNTRQRAVSATSQVQDVGATPGGLIKATLGAAVVAGGILTFIWLPAEYGVDPTGVGHLLGLTQMGHIKEQLHAEADADAAALVAQNAQAGVADPEIHQKLDAIQTQLAALTAAVEAGTLTSAAQTSAQTASEASAQPVVELATWRDEVSYTLVPGQGVEVKLVMNEGAIAEFEWTANGAVVNHDTHGDGNGQSISYEKGRSVPGQSGQLVAAFTGNHGWFWRNRTDDNVDVTLRTRGDYVDLALP